MWIAAGVVVALLTGVLGYQKIVNERLGGRLSVCKQTNSLLKAEAMIHHAERESLEAAVRDQNLAIADYADEIERRERAALDAERRIEEARAQRMEALADLARAQGASCKDGIDLIDRELGL